MTGRATVARALAEWIESVRVQRLPGEVVRACADTVIDTVGLSLAARSTDYVAALRKAWTGAGRCTVLGWPETRDAPGAAVINGTGAHGEDFDNTFEGCPVHAGAVVVPAVFAAAEAYGLCGRRVVEGLAVGTEVMCRLGLVVRKGVHAAGFHPTGVLGTMAAAAAVSAARSLPPGTTVNALGIAGSLAGGLIEYLADGSWTKRIHAGWAAQNGLRAAAMAHGGFTGPATVFEGRHGLVHGFAPSAAPDFAPLTDDLGETWWAGRMAFKPYACGTMTQPFVDCAVRLARKVSAEDIESLTCRVGEGTVHRLWEPLAEKQRPSNGYGAKFSTPYCVAVGFLRGGAGLAEFTDACVRDAAVLGLARRVGYEIDPNDAYPHNYTGHIRAVLRDGSVVEERQPYLRGGTRSPMSREELLAKCAANVRYGGLRASTADRLARFADGLAGSDSTLDLEALELSG